jgi:hypothetical protein
MGPAGGPRQYTEEIGKRSDGRVWRALGQAVVDLDHRRRP